MCTQIALSHRAVCSVNTQLDCLQQETTSFQALEAADLSAEYLESIGQLQDIINSISVTSKTQPLLSPSRLADLLSHPLFSRIRVQTAASDGNPTQISNYVWIVAAKAAVQTSGLVMNVLLDQTLQLHDETYYWSEMLGSFWYSGLYAVQCSPEKLYQWMKDTYIAQTDQGAPSFTARWARFYQISLHNAWKLGGNSIRAHLLFPIRSCRAEMRRERDLLQTMKELHTSSLGLLMEGWHLFDVNSFSTGSALGSMNGEWRNEIYRATVLIEAIFQQIALEPSTRELEQRAFATLDENTSNIQMQVQGQNPMHKPLDLIERLVHILRHKLPDHTTSMSRFIAHHGRPSCIVRYWLPVLAVILSGSTSMKFLTNRQDEIVQWIVDIGSTTLDFWGNWVVQPIRNLIGTIRHDEKSEIAIMSKNSLLADRASLERMVVDFIHDRPDLSDGALADTTTIVNSVKEGDLTPVLKAYERDLRSPFVGTVRGDLIRALLIQIQKTKVDVEIAISGIDALLKSQELVFGYVSIQVRVSSSSNCF